MKCNLKQLFTIGFSAVILVQVGTSEKADTYYPPVYIRCVMVNKCLIITNTTISGGYDYGDLIIIHGPHTNMPNLLQDRHARYV